MPVRFSVRLASLLLHGPISHVWYNFSQFFFGRILQWTAWWSVIPKVLTDQLVFGPIWISLYIGFLGMTQCKSMTPIGREIVECTPTLIQSGLKLWPAAHVITYGVIPVENRLLWVDMVEIVWVIMLSTKAARHQVLELKGENDEEDDILEFLQQADESVILHSHFIPENFFGDALEDETETNAVARHSSADEENAMDVRRRPSQWLRMMGFSMLQHATRKLDQSFGTASTQSSPSASNRYRSTGCRRQSTISNIRGSSVGGQIWVM